MPYLEALQGGKKNKMQLLKMMEWVNYTWVIHQLGMTHWSKYVHYTAVNEKSATADNYRSKCRTYFWDAMEMPVEIWTQCAYVQPICVPHSSAVENQQPEGGDNEMLLCCTDSLCHWGAK